MGKLQLRDESFRAYVQTQRNLGIQCISLPPLQNTEQFERQGPEGRPAGFQTDALEV